MDDIRLDAFRRAALMHSMIHVDQLETMTAMDTSTGKPENTLEKFETWIRIQARQILGETVGQQLLDAMGFETYEGGKPVKLLVPFYSNSSYLLRG